MATETVALEKVSPIVKRGIDESQWNTLTNSLFPGANPSSVVMVWDYCLARKLDPMKKPCHIVPMQVKDARSGQYEWRDVVLPGVYEHRTTAHRTGEYLGHSKPEYGEEIEYKGITVPAYCEMTMYRWNDRAKVRVEFPVIVHFAEVVATNRNGEPNARWSKAPIQMLTKCTEAAGLREAFPDELGGEPTAEEMDGQRAIDAPTNGLATHGTISLDSLKPSTDENRGHDHTVIEQVPSANQPRQGEVGSIVSESASKDSAVRGEGGPDQSSHTADRGARDSGSQAPRSSSPVQGPEKGAALAGSSVQSPSQIIQNLKPEHQEKFKKPDEWQKAAAENGSSIPALPKKEVRLISPPQLKRFFAIAKANGWKDFEISRLLDERKIGEAKLIPFGKEYEELCHVLEKGAPGLLNQEPPSFAETQNDDDVPF